MIEDLTAEMRKASEKLDFERAAKIRDKIKKLKTIRWIMREDIVIKELGFTREMGRAIRAHTTGIPEMTLIDKILFIADRTSKERGFADIDYLNSLLDESIDKAVLYIIDKKIMLQIEKKATMHPDSITARNWIIKNGNI